MIKISVIVPIYNVEKYLRRCLDSLISQTHDSKEIILVNDGSTDKSRDIAEEYANKFADIKLITKENGGVSSARNFGVKLATGDYIMFVDSDDFLEDDALELMSKRASESNADIVRGKWISCDEYDNINSRKINEKEIVRTCIPMDGKTYLKEAMITNSYDIVVWINCIKREYLDEAKLSFIEGVFYEDHEYTLKLLTLGNPKIVQIADQFYYYRNSSQSITKKHDLKKALDLLSAVRGMISYIETSDFDNETYKYAYMTVSIAFCHLTTIYLGLNKSEQQSLNKLLDRDLISLVLSKPTFRRQTNIQNKLFAVSPNLLRFILSINNKKRKFKSISFNKGRDSEGLLKK